MRVSPCRVHKQTTLILPDGFCERFRSLVDDDAPPPLLAWLRHVDRIALLVCKDRHDDLALELRLAHLSLDLTTVDCKISQIVQ